MTKKATPKRVLCSCMGCSDRSPYMATVLAMYLRNAGIATVVESAGILEKTRNGGPASDNGIVCGQRIGLDLSQHNKRWVGDLDLSEYDLFVVVDNKVAMELVQKYGADPEKVFVAYIENPYGKDQDAYDAVAADIMAKMYQVMVRYFSNE